jgi:hypothetical protein
MDRWSAERANAWWDEQPWICGVNFLPSTAVNFLEMWLDEAFDRSTIERELGWASDIGFNAIRVNLHFLVWQHDRDGLLERFDWLLTVASSVGIRTVPCFFDDCGFGGFEPRYGAQPNPIPGVHNSRAVASPGRAALSDASIVGALETYVCEFVARHADDERILFWDLYNEPGNRMIFSENGAETYEPDISAASLRLMRNAFAWARSASPSHPLTVGAWTTQTSGSDDQPYQTEIDQTAIALSDIVSFHAYWNAQRVRAIIDFLAREGRPMICTEWMARTVGSRIEDQLSVFRQNEVGCFQWGFVNGRTQTHLPWPSELLEAHGGVVAKDGWFHDLLNRNGQPYDPEEIAVVRSLATA